MIPQCVLDTIFEYWSASKEIDYSIILDTSFGALMCFIQRHGDPCCCHTKALYDFFPEYFEENFYIRRHFQRAIVKLGEQLEKKSMKKALAIIKDF